MTTRTGAVEGLEVVGPADEAVLSEEALSLIHI